MTAVLYVGTNFALSRLATYLERRGTNRAAGGVAPMSPEDDRAV